jgi:hypothetical protein
VVTNYGAPPETQSPNINSQFYHEKQGWETVAVAAPVGLHARPDRKRGRGRWTTGCRLAFVVLCQIGCIASIAAVSWSADERPLSEWKVKPITITSALSALLSPLQAYLVSSAITIVWWRECERGTTIAKLHNIWGANLTLLVQPWRWKPHGFSGRIIFLVISAISISMSSIATQPMLQRAVQTQGPRSFVSSSHLTLDILPVIPDELSGSDPTTGTATFDFTAAAGAVWKREPAYSKSQPAYACPSNATCGANVSATGITAVCSNTTVDIDLTTANRNTALFRILSVPSLDSKNSVYLNLTTQYFQGNPNAAGCSGKITTERCAIRASKTVFPIHISGNAITVQPRGIADWNSQDLLPAVVGTKGLNGYAGPLAGLQYQYGQYFRSHWYLNGTTLGLLAEALYSYYPQAGSKMALCSGSYTSPTEYVLNSFGEALFHLALAGNKITNLTTQPSSVPQPAVIPVTVVEQKQVTHTDFTWLAAVLVILTSALLLNLVLVWGWWELWQDVSLSPVECAQVFPPSMAGRGMDAPGLFEAFGKEEIRL